MHEFEIKLGETYYNAGIFNVRKEFIYKIPIG